MIYPSFRRVAYRHLLRLADVAPVAPSAEGDFFDNPERREVREFFESGALSNDAAVARAAAPELGQNPKAEVAKVQDSPPTPTEIVAEPGGKPLSTLNRYLVESVEPVPGHEGVSKHPDIKAGLKGRRF